MSIVPVHPQAHLVHSWATATTTPNTPRTLDLLRDKSRALLATAPTLGLFAFIDVPVAHVTPEHIQQWVRYMESKQLAPNTIYARVSRVSSFYTWLKRDARLADLLINPVTHSRPKAPTPYANGSSKSLTDTQCRALLQAIKLRADEGTLYGLRDYAMLLFYIGTGKRRSEIVSLTTHSLTLEADRLLMHTIDKGSLYRATEIRDPSLIDALLAYLHATERTLNGQDAPLWLRHDPACQLPQAVSSHGFVKNIAKYAERVGIYNFHLHQTRHTFARIIGEQTGDLTRVQAALGHQNLHTTRVYLDRVSIKRDTSRQVLAHLAN